MKVKPCEPMEILRQIVLNSGAEGISSQDAYQQLYTMMNGSGWNRATVGKRLSDLCSSSRKSSSELSFAVQVHGSKPVRYKARSSIVHKRFSAGVSPECLAKAIAREKRFFEHRQELFEFRRGARREHG